MLRYCVNCEKEYEFDPVAVGGQEDLICPVCGGVVGKNSRRPVDHSETNRIEAGIGNAYAAFWRMAYVFYLVMALGGFAGFFFHWDRLLYFVTGISVLVFLLQYFTGTLLFTQGVILLPLGAVIGYGYFRSLQGACFGIHVVFFLRHIIRDIFFAILWKLIRLGNK